MYKYNNSMNEDNYFDMNNKKIRWVTNPRNNNSNVYKANRSNQHSSCMNSNNVDTDDYRYSCRNNTNNSSYGSYNDETSDDYRYSYRNNNNASYKTCKDDSSDDYWHSCMKDNPSSYRNCTDESSDDYKASCKKIRITPMINLTKKNLIMNVNILVKKIINLLLRHHLTILIK